MKIVKYIQASVLFLISVPSFCGAYEILGGKPITLPQEERKPQEIRIVLEERGPTALDRSMKMIDDLNRAQENERLIRAIEGRNKFYPY